MKSSSIASYRRHVNSSIIGQSQCRNSRIPPSPSQRSSSSSNGTRLRIVSLLQPSHRISRTTPSSSSLLLRQKSPPSSLCDRYSHLQPRLINASSTMHRQCRFSSCYVDDDDDDDYDRTGNARFNNSRTTIAIRPYYKYTSFDLDRRYSMTDHISSHKNYKHLENDDDIDNDKYQYHTATTSTNPIFPPTKYLWCHRTVPLSPPPLVIEKDDRPPSYSNDPLEKEDFHCTRNNNIGTRNMATPPPPTTTTTITTNVNVPRSPPSPNNIPTTIHSHPKLTTTPSRFSNNHHHRIQPSISFHSLSNRYSRTSSSSSSSSSSPTMCHPTNAITQVRTYHTTPVPERSAVAIVLGLGAVSVGAYAIASVVTAIKEMQQHTATTAAEKEKASSEDDSNTNTNAASGTSSDSSSSSSSSSSGDTTSNATDAGAGGATKDSTRDSTNTASKNIFEEWFGIGVNHKYYEGGFEEKMTRREAALILGIRESSTTARIKDAHRKLLIINHPDTGGSTYITHKINEAKELLLKGRNDK